MHPLLTQYQKFDIIGDVHGCLEPLQRLFSLLGYESYSCQHRDESVDCYRHPEHLAVFVGDLLDRGPKVREVLRLVRAMEEQGHALVVLGNHEYNAIAFAEEVTTHLEMLNHVENLDAERAYLIEDSPLPVRLQHLMKATLVQFAGHVDEWQSYCEWLRTLPLFLESDVFRVVHACWDAPLIDELRRHYDPLRLSDDFYRRAREAGSFESRVIDRLTRGTSIRLPEGMESKGFDGFIRRFFRTKFWSESPRTYGDVVFQPDPLPYELVDQPIEADEREALVHYGADETPVFFGHYWLKGRPKPLLNNVACLDYSAVNAGRLAAYRFEGEQQLESDRFTWVYVDPHKPE